MEKIARAALYAVASLPFTALYLLADFIFFISFYLIRYRRKVVDDNLRHAFPEFSEKERQRISKVFFRSLCDMMVETIKLLAISSAELKKRCKLADSEGMRHFFAQQKGAMLLTGHFMNWEWAGEAIGLANPKKPVHVVYLKIKSVFFNDLMHRIRSRFGNVPVNMELALRHITHHRKDGIVSCFLADQTPQPHQIGHWSMFMNRMTGFFTGPEKIASRLDQNVYFGYVKKLKRGYYEIHIDLMSDQPSTLPSGFITEDYVRRLERVIHEAPANWLWSHRRWKHSYERYGKKEE